MSTRKQMITDILGDAVYKGKDINRCKDMLIFASDSDIQEIHNKLKNDNR